MVYGFGENDHGFLLYATDNVRIFFAQYGVHMEFRVSMNHEK